MIAEATECPKVCGKFWDTQYSVYIRTADPDPVYEKARIQIRFMKKLEFRFRS